MDSILSAGIDIGTTTTSVIISSISFSNTAVSYMAPQVDIVDKEILYRSRIYETPLLDENHLDGEKIKAIVTKEYANADVTPDRIESGAVIITGESLLKENADVIAAKLSEFAGDFVVATAGPDLESVLAGKGAGAQVYSKENSCTVANIDVGGGTSNIAVFNCGDLIESTSLDIGGRLMKYDENGKIIYISKRLRALMDTCGITGAREGADVTDGLLRNISRALSEALFQIFRNEDNELAKLLLTNGSNLLKNRFPVTDISLSGGVAECMFSGEKNIYKYKDIGVSLAEAIGNSRYLAEKKVIRPKETIRATVVGAGIHTVSLSGSTITYSDGIFPVKNVPAVIIGKQQEQRAYAGDPSEMVRTVLEAVKQTGTEKLVLCMKGKKKVSYREICNMAEALAACSDELFRGNHPLMVITENDMAKALGQLIRRFQRKHRDIICMDKLVVSQGDYIDIGKPVMNGITLPVAVKTLIFE